MGVGGIDASRNGMIADEIGCDFVGNSRAAADDMVSFNRRLHQIDYAIVTYLQSFLTKPMSGA